MKALPAAPLTDEDWAILVNHHGNALQAYPLGLRLEISRESDRRDADLMLAWRRFRLLFRREAMDAPNISWIHDESEPRWQPVGGQQLC